MTRTRRIAAVCAAAVTVCAAFCLLPPISQDPSYHVFADARRILGIPNFWNVVSNAGFLAAACYGAMHARGRSPAYVALTVGAAAVAFGSAWYHLAPGDSTLFWDRLPMTIVFAALVSAVVGERISPQTGLVALGGLLALGAGGVLWWRLTGDLRLYAAVQFGPMLLLPLLLVLFPSNREGAGWPWSVLILYALAKLLEHFDHTLLAISLTGGHPWKHIVGGLALFIALRRHARPPKCALSPNDCV